MAVLQRMEDLDAEGKKANLSIDNTQPYPLEKVQQ
jgi:hypothetical protein